MQRLIVNTQNEDGSAPLQVLSYANFSGQQPSYTRFECRVSEDGVRLTEEPLPNAGWIDQVFGLILLLVGLLILLAVLANLGEEFRRGDLWAGIIIPTLLIISGAGLHIQGRTRNRQEICFEVRDGLLTISIPSLLRLQRQWQIDPGLKIRTVGKTPGLVGSRGSLGIVANVAVQTGRFRFATLILRARPKDECDWIVRELTAARDRYLNTFQAEPTATPAESV